MTSNVEQNGLVSSKPQSFVYENPKWLTAELFEKLLSENVPNYRQIKNFEAKPALTAGENFCTFLVRVKIEVELKDGSSKPLSYMMKLPQESEFFQQMMANHNIFEIESNMYNEVVPEFEKLYRDAGAEKVFSPKSYPLESPSKYGVIVLEDLGPAGYKNANRLEGLDLEHTEAVLVRLVEWHAASAVRVETKGLYSDLYNKGLFNEAQRDTMSKVNKSTGMAYINALKTYEGFELYIESVVQTLLGMLEDMFQTANCDPNEFNVLNHGDCWVNNVMFKHDSDGKLIDTLLIDYQMVNYGSPAKDLHYFLMSSTNCDLKVDRFDYFIKFYHDNLVKNLKLLKYPKKPPTLKELHIAMIKYGIWGFFVSITVLGLALMEPNANGRDDGFFGTSEASEEYRRKMYMNSRYRKHMKVLIPWMSNRGVFGR